MPTYQQITFAREKAKRIRECAVSFRSERDRSLRESVICTERTRPRYRRMA
jgi:hypothetical protein